MDRLVYYRKVLKKNPAYDKAITECIDELEKSSYFNKMDETVDKAGKKLKLHHYLLSWAPVLTEFAAWVLYDAKKRGIKKLYFLSRDAWPIYRAALAIIEGASCTGDVNSSSSLKKDDLGLRKTETKYPELHYLRVSRYALRIPEMTINKDLFIDMMFLSGIDVTMRKILQRGALDENEIQEFAAILEYNDSLDRILTRPEILHWKSKAALHKEKLWPIVRRHSRERLPATIGYLRQEGMLSGDRIAIVDSGWVGTTQRSLLRLLNYEKPGIRLLGYYFGLYEIPKDMDPDTYKYFYFGPKGQIKRKVHFSNCLFEAVSSEASGMTLSYGRNSKKSGNTNGNSSQFHAYECADDRFYPEVAEYGSLNSEYLEMVQPFLEMFARAYVRNMKLDNGVRISESILTKLMAKPDTREAGIYGSLKFCDDVLEGSAQDIAARLSYKDIQNLRLLRKTLIWLLSKFNIRTADIHESGWIYASIVRCGIHVRWSLMQARMYNYLMYFRKSI